MSLFLADTPLAAAAWLAVKATAILAGAALLQVLWRRRASAATRHLMWTLAVGGLLLLPGAWLAAPRWSVAVARPAAAPAAAATQAEGHEARPATSIPAAAGPETFVTAVARPQADGAGGPRIRLASAMFGLYLAGLAGVLLSLALHHWHVRRLAARATPVIDGPWMMRLAEASAALGVRRPVRLLRSREVSLPMTFGTRTPAIVVPATADLWSDDRCRTVLLHELAHVARYDCLTQSLALIACAAYWPHPAVWWVARQLRVERELACDDRVLAAGAEARAYAGHLLDIAYSLGGGRAPALAVSMARPSQLEGRLLAALDDARNRRAPGRVARLTITSLAAMAVVALAGATPIAIEPAIGTARVPASVASKPRNGAAPTVAVRAAGAVAVTAGGTSVGAAQDERGQGTWELKPTTTAGLVYLRISERHNSHGTTVPLASLEGLTDAQVSGAGGPVQFRVTRDGGTLHFEGVVRNGVGAGTFSFAPNAAFPAELEKRGFARPTAREQYLLARADIGYAFLDELNRLRYAKPTTAELVTAGQHGVDTEYLREMGALGYALGSLPPLVTLRDHGVGPEYVRGMAEAGYAKLPADTLRLARDHGVDPKYAQGMRTAGYAGLSLEALINARDHGVTPDYVSALADGGHRSLPLDQVVRARDHGVDARFVGGMRELGYTLSLDELVRARDHGVDAAYVRGMAAAGYTKLPIERLVTARNHGVTPDYASAMKGLGYDSLTLEDLVMLRDHGVTPDRVRSANARTGTRLPIDVLRSLADGGGLR
jgi:beta-lactamase regulating signal transducer with metallopeptidase domain